MKVQKIFSVLIVTHIVISSLYSQDEPVSEYGLINPLPDALVSEQGVDIDSPRLWKQIRREEVLGLFRDHVYGNVPDHALNIDHVVKFLDRNALGGSAIMKEVDVHVSKGPDTLTFTLLIYLPPGSEGPVPLFLGLNFLGNQAIHPDPHIGLTTSWVRNRDEYNIRENRVTEETRGVSSSRWPVEMILSRGYGLATLYAGDIDPDFDDGFENGIHGLFPGEGGERDPGTWGTIAAWAWGLSRAMDYLETDAGVDPRRVAVIGHSRMGKTSLWAGAQDERFALVISNNSGCGGAALSMRAHGETVARINSVFPHWFNDRFQAFNDNEKALPVDQHMLLALIAPRPLYVASAQEDDWADPYGEYLSLYHASRVYGLFGNEVLESDQLPGADQVVWKGKLAYHMRTGKHDIKRIDWQHYLDFADRNMLPGEDRVSGEEVTADWIQEHIRAGSPRLILTPELESMIRKKLAEGNRVTMMGMELLKQNAESILGLEPLSYAKTGRRLLGVSREAIRRMTTLALAYRFEQEERYLDKLEQELLAVCAFSDWNPSHFLDVAEMAAAVALSIDWAGEWLSPGAKEIARNALVEKAMKPALPGAKQNSWTRVINNWNLVCNGGLSLAALAMFEEEPEISARVLDQAVRTIPLALTPYAPHGIYPEGPSYWFYATTYLVAAISAFESALGCDFGFTEAPGVLESSLFSQVTAGPSGQYYNYFDAGLEGNHSLSHFGLLAWFARRSSPGFDKGEYEQLLEKELEHPDQISGTRFFSMFYLDIARMESEQPKPYKFPAVWTGEGLEPLCIFRDPDNKRDAFFLAAKGGMAADNHGNMDAGSFIFELNGIRWAQDPGNQNYHDLEVLMGNELWNKAQGSGRWTLLTKNNFGHSTLTINDAMHRVEGRANLIGIESRERNPHVTFDLTGLFGEDLLKAHRTFTRKPGNVLSIKDEMDFSPGTANITWQMITQAEVDIVDGTVMLTSDERQLNLEVDAPVPYEVKVVSLSPPPLDYDKDIPGLKRIEIRFKRGSFTGDSGQICVNLLPHGS